MNKVIVSGTVVREPNISYSGEMCIAKYTLAVKRFGKKKEGQPDADFISCTAFGKSGEFVEKYVNKGTKLLVTGKLQTGSYTNKEGQRVNTTDVIVDEQEFTGSKSDSASKPEVNNTPSGFEAINMEIEEDLPFV